MWAGSYSMPWQQQGIWSQGAGGVDGNGNISWLTASNSLVPMYQQKLAAYDQAYQAGKMQNLSERQGIVDSLNRWQNIQANHGQTPQMFALPQYSTDNFFTEMNEASRLPGQGGQVRYGAVEGNLPAFLRGQNQGQLMHPWSATAVVGTNMGGGADFGNYFGSGGAPRSNFAIGSSFAGGGFLPTQQQSAAMGGRMPTPYNNGDLRTAGQMGSYQNPLIRSGGNPTMAMANIGNQPGMTPFYLDRYKQMTSGANGGRQIYDQAPMLPPGYQPRRGDLGGWNQDVFMRGQDRLMERSPYLNNPNVRFGTGESYGPFKPVSIGASALPMQYSDFQPRYMGPYSPQYYNNAMNSAAIYGGLLGSDRSPSQYYQPGQGVFTNDFGRRF